MSGEAASGGSARSSSVEQYAIEEVIGKGSFGVVSKIRRREDGKLFVWKELNYGHMSEKEKLLVVSEVNIIRELRHPFIIRYLDRIVEKHTTKLFIVMEYCENGDLGALIKKHQREGTQVEEEFIWKVFVQLILALKECHRHREASGELKPILHRDLKPGNVFLDRSNNIKLGDFGLAKELQSQSKFAYTNVGTPYYMSPELTNEMRYNEKSDIWAVGCLLYELAALRPPFDAKNHLSLAVKINAGKFARIPDRYSDDLYRAIRWMLSIEQSARPTVEDLEAIMAPRPIYREYNLVVKEYTFTRKCNIAAREAKAREDALKARERALAEKEAALAALERRLQAGLDPSCLKRARANVENVPPL